MAGQERDTGEELGELQRRYLEAWQRLASGGASGAGAWSDALEQWRRLSAPGGEGTAADVIARLLAQGQGFMWLGDRLGETAGEGGSAADPVRQLLAVLGDTAGAGDQATRQALELLQLPLASWQRLAESLAPVPGRGAASPHRDGGHAAAHDPRQAVLEELRRLLAMPTLGYMREAQADLQQLAQRWLDYEAAQQAYARLFTGIGLAAVGRLRGRLEALEARGEAVTSLRELYHLWTDCCEEAYAETVASDEYVQRYGRLVNSLMAARRDSQRLANDALGALGMPTRTELETLHRRFQEERRRARCAEATLERLMADNGGRRKKTPAAEKKKKKKKKKVGREKQK